MEILVGTVFLIVGLAVAFGAALLIRRSTYRLRFWEIADGTVVEYAEGRNANRISYRPKVQFLSPGGRTITFTHDVGSNRRPYRIGNAVKILYDPENVENACIRSFTALWLLPILAVFFAGTFITLGLDLLFRTTH